ncbi:hypothetical protein FQA39_LY15422 [Lamprigera yunnana]|nr:hypothetical protein FQA39_LY15422 [Lamprigera yunnana]
MGDWSNIHSNFNSLDETLNFGARSLAGFDNLYETSTLASISNEYTEVTIPPVINALIRNGAIYLSIDKTFRIFENLQCTNLHYNVTFEDIIDTFCISVNADFILLCFRTGFISLLNMCENPSVFGEKSVIENQNMETFFIKATCVEDNKGCRFYIFTNNGMMYRVSILYEVTFDTTIDDAHFTMELVFDAKSFVQSVYLEYPVVLYSDTERCIMYNVDNKETIADDIDCLKKVYSCSTTLYVGLTMNGDLLRICSKTNLICSFDLDTLFDDLLVVTDKSDIYFLLITKKDELGASLIQLLSYPGNVHN